MWTGVLGLALTLAPADAGKLEFTNVRGIYGQFGPTRPDAKVRAGDLFSVGFDIGGLAADAKGRIVFTARLEIRNEKGEVKAEKKLAEIAFYNILGGTQVPHLVQMPMPVDTPAGKYTLKVTVTDLVANVDGDFSRTFEVLPFDFSIVRCQLTYDIAGHVRTSNVGTLGQVLYLNMGIVGFKRDRAKDNQGSISVEMNIVDSQGRPTVAKPVRFPERENAQATPEGTDFWHVQFDLPLNRAGDFKAELKATDHVTGKTATLTIPFQALPTHEGSRK